MVRKENGRWTGDIMINGKRYKKRGFLVQNAAKLWEREKLINYQNALVGLPVDDNQLIEDIMGKFLRELGRDRKIMTIKRLSLGLRHWSKFLREKRILHLSELKLSDGIEYRKWREQQFTPAGNTPSKTTLNHEMKAMRQCMKWAYKWEVIDKNPMHSVPLYERVKNADSVCLTKEQIEVIENSAKNDKAKTCLYEAIVILLRTGMRSGEVCNLKWKDIDFNLKQISVCADNTKSNYARIIPIV